MNKISTGQDATLKTYRQLAALFGPKAEAFIDQKIAESPNGENEEVIADETQMMVLFAALR